jgi:hypothetical protein
MTEEMQIFMAQRIEALTNENKRLNSQVNELILELHQCQQREIHLVAQKR